MFIQVTHDSEFGRSNSVTGIGGFIFLGSGNQGVGMGIEYGLGMGIEAFLKWDRGSDVWEWDREFIYPGREIELTVGNTRLINLGREYKLRVNKNE